MVLSAILWDMDGTLLDSEPVHENAINAALNELGFSIPANFHDDFLGASGTDVYHAVCDIFDIALPLSTWQAIKWRHYQYYATEIEPFSVIVPLLIELKAQGIPMAVVTNSTQQELTLNLEVSGLSDYFSVGISRNDVVTGKPAPDCYQLAAQKLDCSPSQCLVIEDSLTGAQAGIAADMHTLFHPQLPELMDQCPAGANMLAPDKDLAKAVKSLLSV